MWWRHICFFELDLTSEGYWILLVKFPNMEKRKWNERIFQDELDNKTGHQQIRPLLRSCFEVYNTIHVGRNKGTVFEMKFMCVYVIHFFGLFVLDRCYYYFGC